MKRNGYIDESTIKAESVKKSQFAGATIRDLKLHKAITIPAAVS